MGDIYSTIDLVVFGSLSEFLCMPSYSLTYPIRSLSLSLEVPDNFVIVLHVIVVDDYLFVEIHPTFFALQIDVSVRV